jgi:hypothetical protein
MAEVLTEKQEPLRVFVFEKGHSLAGTPSWWIGLDDDEDADECLEKKLITQGQYDSQIEDGYISRGFFGSKTEAIESAEKNGWVVTNKEP